MFYSSLPDPKDPDDPENPGEEPIPQIFPPVIDFEDIGITEIYSIHTQSDQVYLLCTIEERKVCVWVDIKTHNEGGIYKIGNILGTIDLLDNSISESSILYGYGNTSSLNEIAIVSSSEVVFVTPITFLISGRTTDSRVLNNPIFIDNGVMHTFENQKVTDEYTPEPDCSYNTGIQHWYNATYEILGIDKNNTEILTGISPSTCFQYQCQDGCNTEEDPGNTEYVDKNYVSDLVAIWDKITVGIKYISGAYKIFVSKESENGEILTSFCLDFTSGEPCRWLNVYGTEITTDSENYSVLSENNDNEKVNKWCYNGDSIGYIIEGVPRIIKIEDINGGIYTDDQTFPFECISLDSPISVYISDNNTEDYSLLPNTILTISSEDNSKVKQERIDEME